MEARGFEKALYANVVLESAQKLNLNPALALGSVEQQVTVAASPGLLDTATASGVGGVDQTKWPHRRH